MNTYLKYQPPGIQFVVFIGLSAGFFVLTALLTSWLFPDIAEVLQSNKVVITTEMINKFKWAQLASAILSFVVPALLFGYYSAPTPFSYLGLHKNFSALLLLFCIVLLFAIQPFVGWLGTLNAKANFGSLQQILKQSEERYNKALETFLSMKNTADLLLNLVVMALIPAIGEELFFRGSLQRVLVRWSKKPWLAILISSLIFALLHGTFFKILPIFTLGIMLGTVYFVTRNLWYNIIIHFLNNAAAVLAVYFSNRSETIKKFANDNVSLPFYTVVVSLAVTLGIIYLMKKSSDKLLPATAVNDDNDYIA